VGFSTEMARSRVHGGGQIPLDHRELLIATLNHKPVNRILADDPANLALEFFQTRHHFSADFFAAASSLRNAAMVSAEGSFRLPFFGRRLVLLV
jgi:hypothetical protein